MMHRRELFAHLTAATLSAAEPARRQISVGAASNLTGLAPRLAEKFQQLTGIRVVFSFASTAQLARQLQDGAPFDVFCAADTSHVDELVPKGILVKESRAIYAIGILALWFPTAVEPRRFEDLVAPGIRTIALARPELAPYGAAAVEALKRAGLLARVQSRLVYAGSVAMAKQYGVTGNADAVFAPKALLLNEKGTVTEIDARLYQPIEQALGVVSASKQRDAAASFCHFLVTGEGRATLLASGYK
ncbi:MAG: molybdenum transporter molybdenum-binding protein [Bryobacterales bacterium]|nr:molybdenum transporter molybdenum-binding protein [Bryobacterales bacterium]